MSFRKGVFFGGVGRGGGGGEWRGVEGGYSCGVMETENDNVRRWLSESFSYQRNSTSGLLEMISLHLNSFIQLGRHSDTVRMYGTSRMSHDASRMSHDTIIMSQLGHMVQVGCHMIRKTYHMMQVGCHMMQSGCHMIQLGCHMILSGCHSDTVRMYDTSRMSHDTT